MAQRRVLPYGSWPSPITIDSAIAASLSLREPRLDSTGVYWTEGRPAEGGRQVIVRRNEDGTVIDLTPPPFNARTMANEYGGGAYAVHDGTVFFSNMGDGRIYRIDPNGEPSPLTAEGPYRYGDLVYDVARRRLLCVREDHTDPSAADPPAALVSVNAATGAVAVLASGHDFYSTPRPSPDGTRLAWLAWRHPNMPWDTTELWLSMLNVDGRPVEAELVAGGGEESIVQPEWAPDGSLLYVSDRSGWWNLYRWHGHGDPAAIWPREAEFAGPQWVFGMSWYGVASDGTIVAIVRSAGSDTLWLVPRDGEPRQFATPEQSIAPSIQVMGRRVCYVGSSPSEPAAVVLLDMDTGERIVLRRQLELELDPGWLSAPEAIEFPTSDGHTAHALYYPPTSPAFRGPEGERPPLVVMIHGGPTSAAVPALDLVKQLFTSRGFAVVDVNYRGSTGYGREYMRLLDGKWGIYDVDDCVAAARFLAERGDVDPDRMAITGGSAGGYTTLCALTFHDVFAAGASHYGVGDLEALARDTHKFESRYMDRLVAPYPAGAATYRERSPIHHVDGLSRPLIVTQGADDKVVPIAQAEQIVAALRERHIPHAYLLVRGRGPRLSPGAQHPPRAGGRAFVLRPGLWLRAGRSTSIRSGSSFCRTGNATESHASVSDRTAVTLDSHP
jgi:dipeptidyl aminopeptidase/acylaminoacyl peptidase